MMPEVAGLTLQAIFEKALNLDPDFSDEDVVVSEECKDLIRKLLSRDPMQRLGHNGASEIKEHPFFRDMDWNSLLRNKAAFVPALQSEIDTGYFHDKPVSMSSYQMDIVGGPGKGRAVSEDLRSRRHSKRSTSSLGSLTGHSRSRYSFQSKAVPSPAGASSDYNYIEGAATPTCIGSGDWGPIRTWGTGKSSPASMERKVSLLKESLDKEEMEKEGGDSDSEVQRSCSSQKELPQASSNGDSSDDESKKLVQGDSNFQNFSFCNLETLAQKNSEAVSDMAANLEEIRAKFG
eukprot:jgi/Botrbrau1/8187/Bobra.357_2s0030.1